MDTSCLFHAPAVLNNLKSTATAIINSEFCDNITYLWLNQHDDDDLDDDDDKNILVPHAFILYS